MGRGKRQPRPTAASLAGNDKPYACEPAIQRSGDKSAVRSRVLRDLDIEGCVAEGWHCGKAVQTADSAWRVAAARAKRGQREDGWVNPSEVRSKRSILAKHLYFDSSIAPRYNLRCEADRQKFLEQDCRIPVNPMRRAAAREYERERERTACIRYVGRVINR